MKRSVLENCIKGQIGLSQDQLDEITSNFKSVQFSKGDFLIRQGAQANAMYFIVEGYLRLYSLAGDEEVTLWIAGPSNFVTDLSGFVHHEPAQWNIQALTDLKCMAISRTDHESLLNVSAKWMEFDNKLLANAFKMLEQRMFSQLHLSAKERYDLLMSTQPEIIQHVPLLHIASMLGMKPETLSRMRSNS